MRKVTFKEWTPPKYGNASGIPTVRGHYSEEYTGIGYFHQWGVSWEEVGNNTVNYTIGIIELEDGTIQEIPAFNIKFRSNDR